MEWKERKRKTGRERKRERAEHIEGEHWPGALIRAAVPFSRSFRRLREEERKNGETRKNKNPVSIHTYGSVEAGGAPYSCTNLTSALLE